MKTPEKIAIFEIVEREVTKAFNLEPTAIFENNRIEIKVFARQTCYYLIRQKYNKKDGFSSREIGERYGKDHATVLHGIKKIKEAINIYPAYRDLITEIQAKINN